MNEIWKQLPFAKEYEISNFGRLKSLSKEMRTHNSIGSFMKPEIIVKLQNDKDGYHQYCLNIDALGKRQTKRIHRLVAEMFLDNPEKKPAVNHKDGNKKNNHVDNLEWATQSENEKHAYRTGLKTGDKQVKAMMAVNNKLVLNTQTGIFYENTRAAAESLPMNRSTLISMLCGEKRNKTPFTYV